jgi:hypothetical protein
MDAASLGLQNSIVLSLSRLSVLFPVDTTAEAFVRAEHFRDDRKAID